MFGLMHFRGANDAVEERRRWRMHYCGTCKTIGRQYGQRSRMLLNHDVGFLAELLTALSADDVETWGSAYRSWNCVNMPADGEIPPVLRYAAAVNVLLSDYKLADHEVDSRKRRWVWARRIFSRGFRNARHELAALGFPLAESDQILGRQVALEAASADLDAVAEPTAQVTALVFRHGAVVAGIPDRADELAAIGYRFGHLTYLLDAWEDFEKDRRTGAFNPLVSRESAGHQIRKEAAEITLPEDFKRRLQANIADRLSRQFPIRHACSARMPQGFKNRWRSALSKARELRTPLWATAAVVAIAFLFPLQARIVRSPRECLSLGMNLMALGGLMATVPLPTPGKKGPIRSALSSCCGDSCDGCDCCDACDSCDCCDACSSCDC
jgi:hypothetical protein